MTVAHPAPSVPEPNALGAPPIKQQAGVLLSHVAGYAGYRAIALGLRSGLVATLAEGPATADELAKRLGLDPFYVAVWCRGAIAYGIGVRAAGDRFALAPEMSTLLLDESSPAYAGALFEIFSQREAFDRFERVLSSGERLWWDECSSDWITAVSRTAMPFYTRLVPGALDRIPGAAQSLAAGTTVADLGSGLGLGLVRLAQHYPQCHVVGIDGDHVSIELAKNRVNQAGVADRVDFLHTPLEDLDSPGEFGVVVTNLTMHECRDIDTVTQRVWQSLEPGGWFCISDFPFPENDDALRTAPGRILQGIQFFEAQIDDQLLPRSAYDDLLTRHDFTEIGHLELTPVHAVTYGRRPAA
ncbi:methyltransferase domain-containing protein [Phytoactinopolyspora alkaliphila]|uniref:Methyltransferase domain-containing protein n=1 Tax=Phytoactinopolyspora alkaliphila TaxID=1783498 RepID=A0A6N9YKQ2_9ACTN|nr:class I SAM-dependent methyltransferase [Phytoactinopolyspora alkaliphila]NED95554.1 methyltransferase domain-containing protein [Phytoactinopolyspora alkaliphila]